MTISEKPLLFFLQPSRQLITLCWLVLLVFIALALTVPYPLELRFILLLAFSACWYWQFERSVLLRHKRSIICLGRDQQGWWFQRRNGERSYGELGAGCTLWQYFLILEWRFGLWHWPVIVMLMADSLESREQYRQLKYHFYLVAHQRNQ